MIRANIRVKPGDPYLKLSVDDDVRNLYATGQFLNIRVADASTTNGIVLTYVLQGKPRLTAIKFQGNEKYSDSKLLKKLTSKVGEPLDEQKLFTDAQEIQKMYQKAGYPGTQVKYVPSVDENAGRGTVTFDIHEGRKIKIDSIEFEGAVDFTQKQLRKSIKTREHGMWSWLTGSGVFKDEQFEDDQEMLRQFYWDKGYIDFELKEVIRTNPTPRTMIMTFVIYEGRQYKVGSVKFEGNKLFTVGDIAQGLRDLQRREEAGALIKKTKLGPNGLKMDLGDVYTPKGFAADMQQIADFYGARGYIDVSHSLSVLRVPNTESGTMDLEFKFEEGQKSTIEKIEIRGNFKTKDRVIRRELTVAPGEVFNMVQVENSKRRIEGLSYFGKVEAHPEQTSVPRSKNLVLSVEEANTGNMMVGAGFSSVDSFVAFAEVTQGNFDLFHPPNFTGGGQKFRLRVALGTEHQDYVMSFVEPWFLGRHLQLGVDIYHEVLNFQSPEELYDETRTGGRVGLTRPLFGLESFIGTIGYRLEDIGISFNGQVARTNSSTLPPPIVSQPKSVPNAMLEQEGHNLVSKFDLALIYDTRGYGYLPNQGQKTEFTAELAGPFGGSMDYYKLGLRTHWYFKGFAPGHVIEALAGVGVADSYGGTSDVPFYDRYYLGGINTLRGFKYRNVAPREAGSNSKEPIGGDTYWIGSVEYSLPIIERLRVAAFYDVGQVRLNPYSFSVNGISSDFGFGLRINLPIGGPAGMPLRLDYGIPIKHDRFNSGSGKFQFSGGFERPF
jgi:outer membrane protein insertion porin family